MLKQLDGSLSVSIAFDSWLGAKPIETLSSPSHCQLALVSMSSALAKSAGNATYASQDPFIHGNQYCPKESLLLSVLEVRSFYVNCNKFIYYFIQITY